MARSQEISIERSFGEILKLLRKEAGVTLEQLGARLEVTASYLGMVESGMRKPIKDRPKLLTIASTLNLDDSYLRLLMLKAGLIEEKVLWMEPDDVWQAHIIKPPKVVWILASKLQESSSFTNSVLQNIKKEKTKYVFFQSDIYSFEFLLHFIKRNLLRHHREISVVEIPKVLAHHLELIQSPPTLMPNIMIVNPGLPDMEGGIFLYRNREIVQMVPMESNQLNSIYSILSRIYDSLQIESENKGPWGYFIRAFPLTPRSTSESGLLKAKIQQSESALLSLSQESPDPKSKDD